MSKQVVLVKSLFRGWSDESKIEHIKSTNTLSTKSDNYDNKESSSSSSLFEKVEHESGSISSGSSDGIDEIVGKAYSDEQSVSTTGSDDSSFVIEVPPTSSHSEDDDLSDLDDPYLDISNRTTDACARRSQRRRQRAWERSMVSYHPSLLHDSGSITFEHHGGDELSSHGGADEMAEAFGNVNSTMLESKKWLSCSIKDDDALGCSEHTPTTLQDSFLLGEGVGAIMSPQSATNQHTRSIRSLGTFNFSESDDEDVVSISHERPVLQPLDGSQVCVNVMTTSNVPRPPTVTAKSMSLGTFDVVVDGDEDIDEENNWYETGDRGQLEIPSPTTKRVSFAPSKTVVATTQPQHLINNAAKSQPIMNKLGDQIEVVDTKAPSNTTANTTSTASIATSGSRSYRSNSSNSRCMQQKHQEGDLPQIRKNLRQREDQEMFWNLNLKATTKSYGTRSKKSAESLMNLGYAQINSKDYLKAVCTFSAACKIFMDLGPKYQLAVAKSMESIGLAWSCISSSMGDGFNDQKQYQYENAIEAYTEAFQIRYDQLGPWHVDTVDTLNKIGTIHLRRGEFDLACTAYWEVYWVRKAIFGQNHPSVAVSARALGRVFMKLNKFVEAGDFFKVALDIFHVMELPNDHAAVVGVSRDIRELQDLALIQETCGTVTVYSV